MLERHLIWAALKDLASRGAEIPSSRLSLIEVNGLRDIEGEGRSIRGSLVPQLVKQPLKLTCLLNSFLLD